MAGKKTVEKKGGIHRARAAGSQSLFRYPKLRIGAGDRARFWFLSDGEDEYFDGARFHLFPRTTRSGKVYNQEVMCLRLRTDGDESCTFCEEGHEEMALRFSIWIWVDHVLHLGDNPDPEGQAWEQIRLAAEKGKKKGRIMFKEAIGQPMVIWMAYGKEWVWFSQFDAALNQYGTLEGRLYELKRVGSNMQDTDYTLSMVKATKLPKTTAEKVEAARVSIDQIFAETVSGAGTARRPTRLSDNQPEDEAEEGAEEAGEEPQEEEGIPQEEEPAEDLV